MKEYICGLESSVKCEDWVKDFLTKHEGAKYFYAKLDYNTQKGLPEKPEEYPLQIIGFENRRGHNYSY